MKYNNYDLEDFLKDKHFISWVLHPTEESDRFWENWLKSNPDTVLTVRKAKEIILSARFKVPEKNVEAKQEVLEKIMKGYTSHHGYQIRRHRNHTFLKVAALIPLLLVVAFLIWNNIDSPETKEEPKRVATLSKKSDPGQKLSIILPDGSKAILNSLASIKYPEHFEQDIRIVELTGEAFFEVKQDSAKPFIVITENLKAKVLGTSFNINDNSVSLLTGKVEVKDKDTSQAAIVLVPGQKAIHDHLNNSLYKTTYDYQQEIAWKDGIIYFEDADFTEIREKLEKWYGVKFELKPQQQFSWKYTGMFDNVSLEEVLERMSYLEGFNFEIDDKTIIITKP